MSMTNDVVGTDFEHLESVDYQKQLLKLLMVDLNFAIANNDIIRPGGALYGLNINLYHKDILLSRETALVDTGLQFFTNK